MYRAPWQSQINLLDLSLVVKETKYLSVLLNFTNIYRNIVLYTFQNFVHVSSPVSLAHFPSGRTFRMHVQPTGTTSIYTAYS